MFISQAQLKKYIAIITYAKAQYDHETASRIYYWHRDRDLELSPALKAEWDDAASRAAGMLEAFELAGFPSSPALIISSQLMKQIDDALTGDEDEQDFKPWRKATTQQAIDLLIRFSENDDDKAAVEALRDDIAKHFHTL